jgi:hypothetical protein
MAVYTAMACTFDLRITEKRLSQRSRYLLPIQKLPKGNIPRSESTPDILSLYISS